MKKMAIIVIILGVYTISWLSLLFYIKRIAYIKVRNEIKIFKKSDIKKTAVWNMHKSIHGNLYKKIALFMP